MKKRIITFTLTLIMVLSLAIPVGASGLSDSNHHAVYQVVKTLSGISEAKNALYSRTDSEGNSLGPSDYVVSDSNVYLLNTANNSIYQYQGNSEITTLSLDNFDIIGTALSVNKDEVYVLDNTLSIARIQNGDEEIIGSVKDTMDFDNAVDFKVTNEYVYVSEPTPQGGETLRYTIDPTSGDLVFDQTIKGYMVDEDTFYRSKLITEDGQNAGHKCIITIINADGQEIDSITLTSNNYIAGAQYLGTNQDGMYIVKQYDMMCYADGSCDVEETIRTVSKNNTIIACKAIDKNVPSMDDQISVQDGKIYQFSSTAIGTTVNEMKTENMPTDKFSSKLGTYAPILTSSTTAETPIETRALPSVSRSAVLKDAKAYHSDFTWSCTSKNLAALKNWTRPRYINGAGTYSYMPYCWGGFSTTAQYKTGMSNSGRVGNINTSTSGHVANTYGLDCSGYVSRCWRQSTKYGTSTIGSICNSISYNTLRSADALNKSGSHIVLFDYSDAAGHYTLYEATTLNQYDRVAHTNRSVSNLSSGGYVALRYKGITN